MNAKARKVGEAIGWVIGNVVGATLYGIITVGYVAGCLLIKWR